MHKTNLTISQMENRITELKKKFGSSLYMPCHHYQKDEVVQFADSIGDSLELAKLSAKNKEAKFIVFCGVHFMAETADILTDTRQKVILPNKNAGCSLADTANIKQTELAWDIITEKLGNSITPLTYINSTAEIKAFVGSHNGSTLTSSNAEKVLKWALSKSTIVLFLPDQHLGRNTAYSLGIKLEQMAIWNPITNCLEFQGDPNDIKIILWKGQCSTHQDFTLQNIDKIRKNDPDIKIIVHPECEFNVVQSSDDYGSTKKIVSVIKDSPSASKWAIGTEINLVNRLIKNNPDKSIISLNPEGGICKTMNEVSLPNLLTSLENLSINKLVNQIIVPKDVSDKAVIALNNMLSI